MNELNGLLKNLFEKLEGQETKNREEKDEGEGIAIVRMKSGAWFFAEKPKFSGQSNFILVTLIVGNEEASDYFVYDHIFPQEKEISPINKKLQTAINVREIEQIIFV